MNRWKSAGLKALAVAGVAVTVALTPMAGAEAGTTTKKVGGGLWEYGVNSSVFSYYHHQKKYHSATACNNAMFNQCKKTSSAPGAWARATQSKSYFGGNTAYWSTY
ncbi:lactococcin 972 family bacteriocin [Labedella endophytica]|uniref:Lactococcin 972 family bacteriocin n=1 Tax=Labedella endophytica TaxID=1523160 RepID=A0A433JMS3_9MICO|nr:lactococcin 972 family bacteriocin [Labedella endophytica]RUQ96923.1 lactococcin 972 family bacteriocin [Labedella endophytica]